jgi:hypothetical protein
MTDIEKLKNLEKLNIREIKLVWDTQAEDFFIDAIIFDDGTELAFHAAGHLVAWTID